MSSRYLLGLLAAGAIIWSHARWRQGLRAVLILLVVEGAIRKWVFPDAQALIYFAKDALLAGVYLGFLNDRRRPRRTIVPPALLTVLVATAAFGGLQVFNPSLPNALVGLLGFKAYFMYVPLLVVVPAAFGSEEAAMAFLRRYVLLAIPIGVLGAAQFLSGPDAWINAYARGGEATATTFGSSEHVRVTGTFSYITGYSSFLLVIATLVLASLAATRWRLAGNSPTYVALALTLLNMLMTGSRGPVLTLLVLFPLYWWLSVARESGSDVVHGRILLALALVAAVLNSVGSDAVETFYGRATGMGDVESRMLSPFLGPLKSLEAGGLIGFGIGATHQAAEAVTSGLEPYSWLRGAMLEDEPGRVMLELGPLGFTLVYFARLYILLYAVRQVFLLRTPLRRAIATSCVLFFPAHLIGAVIFNVTAGVYFWFFGGLLLLVVAADRETSAREGGRPRPLAEPARPRGAPWRPPPRVDGTSGSTD